MRARAGVRLFFGGDAQLSARSLDHQLSVLLGQLLVTPVTCDGPTYVPEPVSGNVAAPVFAILPGVEVVIGPVGTLADHGK